MKHNREFEIAWQGLKPGVHKFIYDIDDKFMQERGIDESLTGLKSKVTLTFDRHEGFFLLKFDVDGSVIVPCDRCGDEFELRLWDEFNLVIKLTGEGAEEIEDEDDVIFVPRSETVIDMSNWLYEYVTLSLPLQRIHPDKADGRPGCNQQALDLLDKLSEQPETKANPLWKGLDKLKGA